MKTKIVGTGTVRLAYSTVKFPLQTEAGGQHISSSVQPGKGTVNGNGSEEFVVARRWRKRRTSGKSTMYPVHVRNAPIDSRKSRRRRQRRWLLREKETVEEKGVSSRSPEITRIFSVFQRCRTSGNYDNDDDDDGDGREYSILWEIQGERDRKGMKTFASNCEIASAKDVRGMRKIITRTYRYFVIFSLVENYKIK